METRKTRDWCGRRGQQRMGPWTETKTVTRHKTRDGNDAREHRRRRRMGPDVATMHGARHDAWKQRR